LKREVNDLRLELAGESGVIKSVEKKRKKKKIMKNNWQKLVDEKKRVLGPPTLIHF